MVLSASSIIVPDVEDLSLSPSFGLQSIYLHLETILCSAPQADHACKLKGSSHHTEMCLRHTYH